MEDRIYQLIESWEKFLEKDGLTCWGIAIRYYDYKIEEAQSNRSRIFKYIELLKDEGRIFSHFDFNGDIRYNTHQ